MKVLVGLPVLFLWLLCIAFPSTVFVENMSCIAPPSGLISWVTGEENVCDIVFDNCGTKRGGMCYIQGKVGRAFYFDGVDGEMSSSGSREGYSPEVTFTEELWVNPGAIIQLQQESTSGMEGLNGQSWAIFPNHGGFDGQHAGAGISVGTNGIAVYEHADCYMPPLLVYPVEISGWNHIALVYENNKPTLYLNGKLAKVGLQSDRPHVSASLGLGGAPGYTHYRGGVDEVSLYNRVLSDAEILSLFNAGSAGKCMRMTPAPFSDGK
jgi:hypothetical protein